MVYDLKKRPGASPLMRVNLVSHPDAQVGERHGAQGGAGGAEGGGSDRRCLAIRC